MKENILHPQGASHLPRAAAHRILMYFTTGEGREAVGGGGGLVQGLGWLDNGPATRESLPKGGKDCFASEAGCSELACRPLACGWAY